MSHQAVQYIVRNNALALFIVLLLMFLLLLTRWGLLSVCSEVDANFRFLKQLDCPIIRSRGLPEHAQVELGERDVVVRHDVLQFRK